MDGDGLRLQFSYETSSTQGVTRVGVDQARNVEFGNHTHRGDVA